MSDNIMYLLAADPLAMPSVERREWTELLVRNLCPGAHEIVVHADDLPELYLAMTNLEATYCPHCAANLDEWWPQAVDTWWKGGRRDLGAVVPCCREPTSLNELDYDWPQGFARFAIEILNPSHDLEPGELDTISRAAGMLLRVVWAHI